VIRRITARTRQIIAVIRADHRRDPPDHRSYPADHRDDPRGSSP